MPVQHENWVYSDDSGYVWLALHQLNTTPYVEGKRHKESIRLALWAGGSLSGRFLSAAQSYPTE